MSTQRHGKEDLHELLIASKGEQGLHSYSDDPKLEDDI